ncbi:MAG TPA: haloacid dehalogenase type II [Candidatus Limnocylindria bacterium]|jgi:2-haloacid dehalogenase|nr:haloacid dehalogenase type II [Candidatus Limnocylindria bacterium]
MKTTLARRQFLSLTAGAAASALMKGGAASAVTADPPVQAIAFDAFPIFDPRPVFALAEQLFPGRGGELGNEWRTRQFEYTWLRVAAGHYADFWQVTQDALEFAASKLSLELTPEKRDKLMSAHLELKPWPDVPAALAALKQAGFRLAFLSNFTRAMLDANIRSAGLAGRFDLIISTDQAKTYKPDPRAYQLGVDSLKLRREAILFVAFAGWDAAGAKLFGYPTFWVNRQKLPAERLEATPDGVGESFTQLLQFLKV